MLKCMCVCVGGGGVIYATLQIDTCSPLTCLTPLAPRYIYIFIHPDGNSHVRLDDSMTSFTTPPPPPPSKLSHIKFRTCLYSYCDDYTVLF